MGATCKVLAVAVIGLLTRQVEQRREVAQRAADDSRCRSYGFKIDADLARCRMQLDLARLRRRSAGAGDIAIAAVPRCDLAPRLGIDTCDVLGDLARGSILDRDRATSTGPRFAYQHNCKLLGLPALRTQGALHTTTTRNC